MDAFFNVPSTTFDNISRRLRSATVAQLFLSIFERSGFTGPITSYTFLEVFREKEFAKYRKYLRACFIVPDCRWREEARWRDTGGRDWRYDQMLELKLLNPFGTPSWIYDVQQEKFTVPEIPPGEIT